MDVKSIASTQSAISMHSNNIDEKRELISKAIDQQNKTDQFQSEFNKLDPKTKDKIIKESAQKLNEKMQMLHTSLKVEIDKDTGIQVVKIIDENTKEVIRQLPPEIMLKIAKYIDEITGLLFEKRA